jgi:hypothetical protein
VKISLVARDFDGFALRINVLGKLGVHPASKLKAAATGRANPDCAWSLPAIGPLHCLATDRITHYPEVIWGSAAQWTVGGDIGAGARAVRAG